MRVTETYVNQRFAEFAKKYKAVLTELKFDADTIAQHVAHLQHRLATRNFKLYGVRPINMLHAGKRITRFYIKLAFEVCPAQKARRQRLHDQYCERIAEIRKTQPFAFFFSFEATYARQLRINFAPLRQKFYL